MGVDARVGRTSVGSLEFVSELSVKKINRDYRLSLLGTMFNKGPMPSIIAGIEGETSLTSEEIAAGFSVSKPPAEDGRRR